MSVEPIFLTQKDLCMIEHIPEMIDAGIDSFKIEGRMKTALFMLQPLQELIAKR